MKNLIDELKMKKLNENEKQRIIEDILKLVSIQSFTGDRDGILECQTKVSEMATDLGFLCSYRGDVLVIEPRNKKSEPEHGQPIHLVKSKMDEFLVEALLMTKQQ